jgi:hypothetical protein
LTVNKLVPLQSNAKPTESRWILWGLIGVSSVVAINAGTLLALAAISAGMRWVSPWLWPWQVCGSVVLGWIGSRWDA